MPQTTEIHDLIGIGLGPANLALALALDPQMMRFRFLERKPRFGWHEGMLLEDATMQVSFLKDLVTQRDPTSPYSFLCYLKERGRLSAFLNLREFNPTRREFHDYLAWCAGHVAGHVDYDAQVLGIDLAPVSDRAGSGSALSVKVRSGSYVRQIHARNISLALGLKPRMPEGIVADRRIWHSGDLLHRLEGLTPPQGARYAVIGAGQSAAETVMHLLTRDPQAQVHAVMTPFGFLPADDTAFVNEIFDTESVDAFFAMSQDLRAQVLDRHANTNYGVADPEIIAALYRETYKDRVAGRQRLHLERLTRLVHAAHDGAGLALTLSDPTGAQHRSLGVDYLVCATGYRPVAPESLFSDALRELLRTDAQGKPLLGRDYRVATDPRLSAGIYIQGDCENSHGLTATLLSNLAIRAGEISESLTRHAGARHFADVGT